MDQLYRVRFTPSLLNIVKQWSDEDQDVLLGFMSALASHGFDIICDARASTVIGLIVEFVEPGETPENGLGSGVSGLKTRTCVLRVHQSGTMIVIEEGWISRIEI